MLLKSTSTAALAFACAALASPALAGTFDVKGVDVTKDEAELGSNSTYFNGFPTNSDRIRYSSEYALGYGLTDWWKIGLKVAVEKPIGGELDAVALGAEMQTVWKRFNGGWGIAWFASVDFSLQAGSADTYTSGPVLQFGTEKTSLSINPFLVSSFSPEPLKQTDFAYAWQVKHQIREGFAVGIEGYGLVPNIRDAPGVAFQEHRIGPVVYYERALKHDPRGITAPVGKMGLKDAAAGGGDGPRWQMEAGILFGLTEGTQDIAIKFKSGLVY